MKIVYLSISSWQGISIGATHHYGKLHFNYDVEDVVLKRTLSKKSAEELTKIHSRMSMPIEYEEGEETNSWNGVQSIVEHAKTVYKKHFPEADVLVIGDHCDCEPKEWVDGGEHETKTQMNNFFHLLSKLDRDGMDRSDNHKDWKEYDFLCDRWGVLTEEKD